MAGAGLMISSQAMASRLNPLSSRYRADLAHLIRPWFNHGVLVVERIGWRTPALLLERLIEFERLAKPVLRAAGDPVSA